MVNPYRHTEPVRSGAAIFALVLASAGMFALWQAVPARAQDARSILKTTMGKYRDMNSYDGQATADMRETLPNGAVVFQESFTTKLLYQKPNRLRLDFTMPSGGRTIYCNGKTLTFYQTTAQTYSTVPLSPTESADLQRLAKPLLKFQVASRLDTLYFLAGNSIPSSLVGFTRKADDTRNGRPVYVIVAHEASKSSKADITWTWMIDKQTSLLARVEGRLTNVPSTIRVVQNKKAVLRTININRLLSQNIISAKANAPIDPGKFEFSPPPAAKRINVEANPPAGKGQ